MRSNFGSDQHIAGIKDLGTPKSDWIEVVHFLRNVQLCNRLRIGSMEITVLKGAVPVI